MICFIMNYYFRSRCRSDSFIPEIFNGHKQIPLRNLQQGIPERPEPAAPPTRPQPSLEAETKIKTRSDSEEGLRLSREELRAPRAFSGPRRPHRNKEALQQKARREEVEV